MNIAIIANEAQEIEFKFLIKNATILLNTFSTFEEIEGKYDAIFDFLYDDDEKRIESLLLQNTIIFINSISFITDTKNSNFIRFNGWPGFINRTVFEIAIAENSQVAYSKVLDYLQIIYICVPNIIGFITPRVISMIINEAYFTLEENVSTKTEIDIAMKLGTNYPFGPFEWSEKIGLKNICLLLQKLSEKDERYAPSALLINEQSK